MSKGIYFGAFKIDTFRPTANSANLELSREQVTALIELLTAGLHRAGELKVTVLRDGRVDVWSRHLLAEAEHEP